ncbi:MAG: NAD kinase [Calditrichaeota bacterium]|nr:NAD kinase [Calditrichota bacterium]
MILGLAGNRNKDLIATVLPGYVRWLDERNVRSVISSEFSDLDGLEGRVFVAPGEIGEHAEVILSFGGDGTLLNTVNRLHGREIPILGVNLGGLGYLTEISYQELFETSEQLLAGNWSIERRLLLEATVDGGEHGGPWYALNDVVVDKADYGRLIQIRTSIDEAYLNTFRADGLILATPTGSTGYNLSAGGPILEPNMAGVLLTPLNPHSLSNRPLVIDDEKTIVVETYTPADHFSLTVDGQTVARLESGRTVRVRRAKFSACLVTFAGRYFYEVLRRKLGWGDVQIERS